MSGKHTLNVDAGTDVRLFLTCQDANQVPYDLTGSAVEFGLSDYDAAGDLRPADAAGVIVAITGPAAGVIAIHLPAAVTAVIRPGRYDVEVTFPGGDILRILEGPLVVHPGAGA